MEGKSRSPLARDLNHHGQPPCRVAKRNPCVQDPLSQAELLRLRPHNPSPLLYLGPRLSKQYQEHQIKVCLPIITPAQERGHHPMQAFVLQFQQFDNRSSQVRRPIFLHVQARVSFLGYLRQLPVLALQQTQGIRRLFKPVQMSSILPRLIDPVPTYPHECKLPPHLL